ncbi:MAG: 3-phosphoshikimate 1-carboxyvinyltransferase [bacterium]|nr:3-phosphoshikimate 1-carboxyvinyltransferase [bacterium]
MNETRRLHASTERFAASVALPGDKSLSHRALVFSGMAAGDSLVSGLGNGADVLTSAHVLGQLGVRFHPDGSAVAVSSAGVGAWTEPAAPLDCGNSGTTMRLMTGALTGQSFTASLIGDESLSKRPMDRLVEPLGVLGARISTDDDGTPPVVVEPCDGLEGAEIVLTTPSAQLRSAFELGAIQASGDSVVSSPPGYRDHTERWLETMGLGERKDDTFVVHPGPVPATKYDLPGDTSSAAFLWAAAAISPGSEVTTPNISLNAGRIGFLEVLERMGVEVDASVDRAILGDPVGTVRVRGTTLRGVSIDGPLTIAALDELPLLAVVASFADGPTRVANAIELRVKESDRIASTCEMVRGLGGGAEPTADGFEVVGLGWLDGGTVASFGDHRIAMAAGVAATATRNPVDVVGSEATAVSWPDFYETLESLWSSR